MPETTDQLDRELEKATKYTPDEVKALPQVDKVFDRPGLVFDDHDWQQEGSFITDICNPARPDCHHVGIPVPAGKMLMIVDGKYRFVTEEESRKMRTRTPASE